MAVFLLVMGQMRVRRVMQAILATMRLAPCARSASVQLAIFFSGHCIAAMGLCAMRPLEVDGMTSSVLTLA